MGITSNQSRAMFSHCPHDTFDAFECISFETLGFDEFELGTSLVADLVTEASNAADTRSQPSDEPRDADTKVGYGQYCVIL